MFELEKDKCPKCKSENIKITDIVIVYTDDSSEVSDDSWDAHCNNCGWDYVLIDY